MEFAALLPPDSDQRFGILLPAIQHVGLAEGLIENKRQGIGNRDGPTV
jgi:hypothetical protein